MLSVEANTCPINMEMIMRHLNKQLTAILSILIFSIGATLSCDSFAAGGKKATQADLDAEIIDRTEAFNILQNQINNIHVQIDSVQVDSLTYEIGKAGPAGGIVFYVTDGGLHGLEAARSDQSTGVQWGCFATEIGATGTAVGTGSLNTDKILQVCLTGGIAAKLAADYSLNGYTDWFLPSKDTLNQMYFNIGPGAPPPLTNVGRFYAGDNYWSSSETYSVFAWDQYFLNGYQDTDGKDNTFSVRAVRAF